MSIIFNPELPLTAFGDLRTAELSPVFQVSFEYTVDNPHLNKNVVVNGGTVTQADAMAVISSSTTTASISCLQSTIQAKYRAGFGGMARFTALFENNIAATEQYVGLVDEEGSSEAFKNGYVFGYDGTTFGIHRFQNDSKTSIAQASWDDPMDGTGRSGMTLDHTKLNVYQIQFQYLGAGAINFCIEDDSTGLFTIAHTMLYTNTAIVPSTYMPNFLIMFYVDNASTTTDLVVKTSSMAYFVEGKTSYTELQQPQHTTGIQSKTSVTTEIAILTIRNRAAYASKTNFIEVLLEHVTASIEASAANNLGEIRLIRNTTLGGSPSYSDISTAESVIEMDTAGTTVTGGETLVPVSLAGKNDRASFNLVPLKVLLSPGDTITIAGQSANSATIKTAILWKDLF